MKKLNRLTTLLILILMIVSCGESNPVITHIIIKSDRQGVVLDTDDQSIISQLQPLFYEKVEKPDAGPDFRYFIDITIGEKKERWQYSDQGFIRNYEEGFSMIYQVRDVAIFNKIGNVK